MKGPFRTAANAPPAVRLPAADPGYRHPSAVPVRGVASHSTRASRACTPAPASAFRQARRVAPVVTTSSSEHHRRAGRRRRARPQPQPSGQVGRPLGRVEAHRVAGPPRSARARRRPAARAGRRPAGARSAARGPRRGRGPPPAGTGPAPATPRPDPSRVDRGRAARPGARRAGRRADRPGPGGRAPCSAAAPCAAGRGSARPRPPTARRAAAAGSAGRGPPRTPGTTARAPAAPGAVRRQHQLGQRRRQLPHPHPPSIGAAAPAARGLSTGRRAERQPG